MLAEVEGGRRRAGKGGIEINLIDKHARACAGRDVADLSERIIIRESV